MSFRIANKVAKQSRFYQHRLGAVIVKNGRVLSTGYNEIRYSKQFRHPTLHAEESAILKVLNRSKHFDLVGASIFVSRWTPGGRIGLARPCSRCMDTIRSVGIKDVNYTTDVGTETIRC